MKEYALYAPDGLEFPVPEFVEVLKEKGEERYLVSNSPEIDAEYIAPEIDLYLRNTRDPIGDRIRVVGTLYEMRGVRLDYDTDLSHLQEVGRRLLLIGEKEDLAPLVSLLDKEEFDLYAVRPAQIRSIEGTIGELRFHLEREGKNVTLEVDQALWFNAPDEAFLQAGVFDPLIIGIEKSVETLRENLGGFTYRDVISYDPSICQYKDRFGAGESIICGDCADLCPTNAIVKIDENRELAFNPIDCEGCGGCVSVCPSGALDFRNSPRDYLYEAAKLCADKTILLLPEKLIDESLDVPLPAGCIPLAVGGRKFLHEAHFLTLFQESGRQVVFYTDFVSKGTRAALEMVNEISRRRFGREMVLLAMNPEELHSRLGEAEAIEGSRYSLNAEGMIKRAVFSLRLRQLIGERDLGVYEHSHEYIHYGKVEINESNCTLCLSCVGACNTKALTAHPEDNSLRFDASLCTDCTYCEVVCPEADCLHVVRDRLELRPETFGQKIMAKDELFACVECGKEFAPKKAVLAVAARLEPIFGDDELRKRTLYCCDACKPKVMLQAHISGQEQGVSS